MLKIIHSISIVFILGIIIGLVGQQAVSPTGFHQSVFAQPSVPAADTGQRPNILLIVGDDFGWSDIGPFGAEISTPNLDQLAKEGKIGINYHTAPTCSPARTGLLTGVDWHVGGLGSMYELIADNQKGKPGYETYLNDRVVTVTELLRDAGYHTMQAGKWHLSGNGTQPGTTPYDRGFERAFTLVGDGGNHFTNGSIFPGGKETYLENDTKVNRPGNGTLFSNDLYTNKIIEYVNQTHGDEKPLFMYLAFQVAHSPFMTPPGTIEKYDQIYSAGWDKLREQRFEKQKELGIWPANMSLPQGLPPNKPWDSLTQEERDYAVRLFSVRAGMIENMDQNIGRLVGYLKQTGEYDNTLIVFASDNGGSEAIQLPVGVLLFNGVDYSAIPQYVSSLNHSLPNLGNLTTNVNYGAWGSHVSLTPLSGFKAGLYEGGTRAPFIIRTPTVTAPSNTTTTANTMPSPIKSFLFLTDITPTFLDYAGVQHPGSTYKGHEVHPIMGKSMRPILNGSAESIHGADEAIGSEMFNSTGVYKGPWLAMRPGNEPTGEWQLYNIVTDPAQNNNLAQEHPDIVQQMMTDYQKYAEEVGVVIPTGEKAKITYSKIYPPLNQTQTIELDEIVPPFKHPNATDLMNAARGLLGVG